ncbi:acid protease [Chaetomidium leptoderma]|uniref:Acid protease n=1 Tax=Chaetomidium leptoderma TaxID=669021 RepID=A0AAN6ZZW9_9PEZI|nr:acid protease [Chaetomidium leptoderma]
MFRVAALLLQLTLWVATVHAFFPFIPDGHCDPTQHCGSSGPGSKRGAKVDPIAEAAARFTRKFGKWRSSPASELDKRKNTYMVSEPAVPTAPDSAGIYQYGPDYSYFIKVQVGAAQQPFYMLLDTGAANTWLMGSNCKSDACRIHSTFDPSSSKSWRTETKPFSLQYGTGDLTGIVGQDTSSFAGLTHDLSFGLANYTHDDFKHFAFDGILGLAMSSSVTGTFLQTLKAKKLLSSLVVGMSLNRDSDGPNDGQVTFGGVDRAKYEGEIAYTDVQSPQKENGEWAITMDGLSVNGKSAGVGKKLAYIDTGTSFMFAPPDDLAALFKLIPGSRSFENNGYVEYEVPCDTTTPIHLSFSGVEYEMSAQDWLAKRDGTKCVSTIYGFDLNNGTWLVGDTFLKNVYSCSGDDDDWLCGCTDAGQRRRPVGERLNNSNTEEGVGLLTADPASDDDGDDDGSGIIIAHPGSTSSSSTTSNSPDSSLSHHNPRSAPRTPNRVRFDLRPTFVEDHHHHHHHDNGHENDNPYPRESFDTEDSSSSASQSHHHHHQNIPLLTGIEAPSVTLATGDDYDHTSDAEAWQSAERARPKSSLPSAFMNMANSIIGAGIIGQPYAFRQAGLLAGTVLLVVLTVVVDWTIRLIVVNSKLSGATSFQGTVEKCFGRTGLVAISVAQWAFAFGGMVAFGVIVGDSIPSVLRAVWPGLREMPVVGLLADRRVVIVVFTMGISYPLALYRDIAKLAKASTLALVSMAVIVVTVVVQGAIVPAEERGSLKDWRLLVINDGIFQAIGVISFAFVCHHNSLLIYGSLEKPTIDRFSRVTHISTGVSMVACLLMALSGFLTFGDKTQGNVLNNFPADNTMVNLARLCFGLNMLTTLPLEAFVCREVMLNYYFPGEPFNMNLHLIFSTSLVFSAMVLSLLTCDLGTVFDLVGGTSAAAMAYILPPLCYIKLTTRSWKTYVAWAVAAFGCTVMVMSMLQAIGKMIKGEGDTRQCY